MGAQGAATAQKPVGTVTHFFGKINVAIVLLTEKLQTGYTVRFKGHTTDFEQKVTSLQLEHAGIPAGDPGQEVGVLVQQHVREGDQVFRI